MPGDIQSVLGYEAINGAYEAVRAGVPFALPPVFESVNEVRDSNHARQVVYHGTRRTAQTRQYGSNQQSRDGEVVGEKFHVMVSAGERRPIKAQDVMNLVNPANGTVEKISMSEILRRLEEVKTLHTNLRRVAIQQALSVGKIYINARNIQTGSSGALTTVDYGRTTASNEGAGTDMDGNALTGQAWATASTDILGEIQKVTDTAVMRKGYPLRYAIYGADVAGYIYGNDTIKDLIAGIPAAASSSLANELPMVGGLEWIPGSRAFYVDADGTNQTIVGAKEVLFMPAPGDGNWWSMEEGTEWINMANGIVDSVEAAVANMMPVAGQKVYARMAKNALAGFEIMSVDTFLPVLNVADATFKLTVQS